MMKLLTIVVTWHTLENSVSDNNTHVTLNSINGVVQRCSMLKGHELYHFYQEILVMLHQGCCVLNLVLLQDIQHPLKTVFIHHFNHTLFQLGVT